MFAAQNGRAQVVKTLLKEGASANLKTKVSKQHAHTSNKLPPQKWGIIIADPHIFEYQKSRRLRVGVGRRKRAHRKV